MRILELSIQLKSRLSFSAAFLIKSLDSNGLNNLAYEVNPRVLRILKAHQNLSD